MDNQNDYYTDKTGETENGEPFATDEVKTPQAEEKPLYEVAVSGEPKTTTYAVISLLSGIISLLCCCTGFGGLFFGAMAVLFFFLSKKNLGTNDTRAILGLIFGACGLLFSVYLIIELLTLDFDEVMNEAQHYLENAAAGGTEI